MLILTLSAAVHPLSVSAEWMLHLIGLYPAGVGAGVPPPWHEPVQEVTGVTGCTSNSLQLRLTAKLHSGPVIIG